MAVLTRQQLKRRHGRGERRCQECWEARVPLSVAVKLCLRCKLRSGIDPASS